ncbi:hypothetical protein BKA70DRAFT_1425557 [Coprinopsis sp. MPI-PUGE-AT-0042]|nr:hypothetical protein BKA70DRAFT_1425557 [Coprinopsis sp. MPI-PUGE-AT-0042]
MMINSPKSSPPLVDLLQKPTKLNWAATIKTFDRADRSSVDTAALKLLIAILLRSPPDEEPHVVTAFWEPWSNSLYQLRLLDALLSLPGDSFNFVSLPPPKRIVTVNDVTDASPTIRTLAANVQGYTCNTLELFQILVNVADLDSNDIRNCVREMLDKAIKISAEILHMGLLQVPDANRNEIRREHTRKLLAMFLAGHPNHQLVFRQIWHIEPSYLTDAFREFYEENNLNITRVLDVAQDLKIPKNILEARPFTLALDIAALASRRECLNSDKWLADNLAARDAEFLHSVILFLQQKIEAEKDAHISDPAIESLTMTLPPNTVIIILQLLRNQSTRLMSLIPNSESEPGLNVVGYSNEIESEVDAIYKQVYDEQISVYQVIWMLKQYKESANTHDHEVFSSVIHFLFDEYKLFQSYYPASELRMTADLFGALIQHKLIDYIPLGIAIRYIIDALNFPPETNLFGFDRQALSRFEFRPAADLIGTTHRALASNVGGEGPFSGTVGGMERLPVFTAIQSDVMDDAMEEPSEDVSDRILCIVNNLALSIFDAKVKDMREQFVDQYSRWFANYLVDQRGSTEPNNHPLYLRFLDSLDHIPLNSLLVELYHFADLKLNLKFEIEVLCKGLNIDLDTIEPTTILRNPAQSSSRGFGPVTEFGTGHIAADQQPDLESEAIIALLNTLVASVQRAVQLAVDRAVRDIIIPVVERSASDLKLRWAGYLMAQKLAGSLQVALLHLATKANLRQGIKNETGKREVWASERKAYEDRMKNLCSGPLAGTVIRRPDAGSSTAVDPTPYYPILNAIPFPLKLLFLRCTLQQA